ncbi:hypothetical protein BH11ACT8_BH11ACT8_20760 [soil metagenome]
MSDPQLPAPGPGPGPGRAQHPSSATTPTSAAAAPYGYRPPVQVGTGLAIAAVVISGLATLMVLGNALSAIPLASEIADGVAMNEASLLALGLYSLTAALGLVAMLVAWVVKSVWLIGARDVAHQVNPHERQRRGAAWVVLGWVVPIANFFVPFQVVGDLTRSARRGRDGAPLGWWWTTWLATLWLYRIHGKALDAMDPGDSAGAVITLSVLLAVAVAVAFTLWVVLVRTIVTGLSDQAATGTAR